MGNKYKHYKNNGSDHVLRNSRICYSSMCEISHTDMLDPKLNKAWRAITGCCKPIYIKDLYLLAVIVLPNIRSDVYAICKNGKNQTDGTRGSLHPSLKPYEVKKGLHDKWKAIILPSKSRTMKRKRRSRDMLSLGMVGSNEESAKGYDSPWLTWRCINRRRTWYTSSIEQRKKWGYFNGDTTCACGMDTQNTAHVIPCSLLSHHCTGDDLLKFNDIGNECAEQ